MNRTKEKIKNVLIVVLVIGLMYLTYSVWFFDSPFGTISIESLFGTSTNIDIGEGKNSDLETFGIRPMSVFVRDSKGARGSVYEKTESDAAYELLREKISEILVSVQAPTTVSEMEWHAVLLSNGALFDYRGNVPFEAIKLWLGCENGANDICGRFFMFSTKEENLNVYMKNSDSGVVYKFDSGKKSAEFEQALANVGGKPAYLALERSEADFAVISPEVIVVESRQNPYIISAYDSRVMFGETVKAACLESFMLRDVTPSIYAESDGTEVYVADVVTLKISPQGIASYSDTRDAVDDTLGIGVKFEDEVPTIAEKTETARALCAHLASKLPGTGGIYLISVEESADETKIVFGRHIDGIPIDMMNTEYFMQVNIKGESVRAARVNLRSYDITQQSIDVLTERIAAAAVSGSGKTGDLNLRYADGGGTSLTPSWFIGEIRRIQEDGNELVKS